MIPRGTRRKNQRRFTVADVAELAGVSSATVSLVANGRATGRVSTATQERVKRCAQAVPFLTI